jgi:HEPN domain-containing protein
MATKIPFTDREMKRAWDQNLRAISQVKKQYRTNAHRLLLFYAVECGLKVLIMRNKRQSRTDGLNPDILTHDINKLLKELGAQGDIVLSRTQMVPINKNDRKSKYTRTVEPKDFNQMWRYGGKSNGGLSDKEIEEKLLKIVEWVKLRLKKT